MPANSALFNRFLFILALQAAFTTAAESQALQLSPQQLQWLGDRIFHNECRSDFTCLTSWNQGEDFPSLGIGHFIWYRQQQMEPFVETFPALLEHYRNLGHRLPHWIEALPEPDSPWQSREDFITAIDSDEMRQLRQFLADTRSVQTDFIVQRLDQALPQILNATDPRHRSLIETRFQRLLQTEPPYGPYALIDYVHFKGMGTNTGERYQGQGWGLLQVLELMQDSAVPLEDFVTAAETVLRQRVVNAPAARGEQRWLRGWTNRLQTYLPSANAN